MVDFELVGKAAIVRSGMPDNLLTEYVSGGYYLARLAKRAEYMSPELIPDQVLSACGIICDCFPDSWAIEWASADSEERTTKSAAFGISENELPHVMAWATGALFKEFGWPSAFYGLDAAREARERFIPDTRDVVIIGLGLHDSSVGEFLKAARPSPPEPGCGRLGETGVFQCISGGKRMASGGDVAGFELLATIFGLLTDSWLHHGLERICTQKLGIIPNGRGLIESHDEALRCTELTSETLGRFPGLWLPWLIAVYDSQAD